MKNYLERIEELSKSVGLHEGEIEILVSEILVGMTFLIILSIYI